MNKCAFHCPFRLNPSAGYAILSPVITPQKQGLIGLTADFRRRPYTNCICLRGIRQMFMQACPPDSLLRENESSVRDLPLVKQN